MSDTSGSPDWAGDDEPGAGRGYGGNHRDIGQDQDPADRNRYRRRKRRRTLPAQFAEFKLADGRMLREVLGDRFFGAARPSVGGKWISKGVHEWLANGDRPRPIGLGWRRPETDTGDQGSLPPRLQRLRQRAEQRQSLAERRRTELRERIGKWRANRRGPRLPGGGGS